MQESTPAIVLERPSGYQANSKHPFDSLDSHEIDVARECILALRKSMILFRNIFVVEPRKELMKKFLAAEHAGTISTSTPRPPRQARVQYDVIRNDGSHEYMESIIDLSGQKEISSRTIEKQFQQGLITSEFREFTAACLQSPLFQKAMEEFELPEGLEVCIDPWPYGGPDLGEVYSRYTQGLCFAKDVRNGNADSNHYGYPLPIIPVMDTYKKEIVRVDRLATGGEHDGLNYGTGLKAILDHCRPSEYVPELLDIPMRKDIKPLNVVQPEGASFTVSDESLIEWQKWRFRVG